MVNLKTGILGKYYIYLTSSIVILGVASTSPILPAYAQTLGFDPGTVGWLIASFGIARFLTNLPAGILSERSGPFPAVVVALMITASGSAIAAWAGSWQELLAARCIQGIGSGIYMTTAIALVARMETATGRGRRIALYESSLLTGSVIGPLLGGVIADYIGLHGPFLGQALFTLLALVLFVCFSDSRAERERASRPPETIREDGLTLASGPGRFRLVPAYYQTFSIFLTRTVSQFYLIPVVAVDELGFTHRLVGFLLALYGVTSFASLFFVGTVIDRIGSRPASLIGNLVVLSALLGLFLSDSYISFWIFTIGLAVGSSILGASSGAITADLADPRSYGRVFGTSRMWGDAGYILGPIMVGTAISESVISIRGGFFLNGIIVLLAFLAIGASLRRDPRPVPRQDHSL